MVARVAGPGAVPLAGPDRCRRLGLTLRVMATTRREVVQTVVDGVTVEVRRSAKRRRTVSAYRQEGRLVVLVPAR